MPGLINNLKGRDLGYLRIVAELWGLELAFGDVNTSTQQLLSLMLDAENLDEVLSSLPAEANRALGDLIRNKGRLAWVGFTRKYGDVREIGEGKRDREKPYINKNASASEALWYRGLIGRGFFESPGESEEYAYIPDDIFPFLPLMESPETSPLGRPASQNEKARKLDANKSLLDDVCTMLAGLRMGLSLQNIEIHLRCGKNTPYPLTSEALLSLLRTSGLVDALNQPKVEPVRKLLESSDADAFVFLYESWLRGVDFNELHLMPGLLIDGGWKNDPVRARQAVIDFISTIPGARNQTMSDAERTYWSLGALVSDVFTSDPDFQRLAGDYDSWYIRKADDGKFLRGFEHWQEVDGALLKFIIGGPLHWLAVLDLAMPEKEDGISAFRFSAWGQDLLNFKPPTGLCEEEETVTIRADGRLRIPHTASRVGRYQLARFGQWQGYKDGFYRYRVTPGSLEEARKQGLRVEHLLTLLNRHSQAVPPSIITALKRWESQGSQAHIDHLLVLRVNRPEVLQALRNSDAQRYLGEILGPTAVVIRKGGWEKVSMTLAELGYLTENNIELDA